jgi:hypothetical protein
VKRFAQAVYRDPSILWTVAFELLRSHDQRMLFSEMRHFAEGLPLRLKTPIEQAMAELSKESLLGLPDLLTENQVRNLADFSAIMYRQGSIGYCLQRSLTRYHYLRRIGLPLIIHFGARTAEADDLALSGHAWLSYNGEPYYEHEDNWKGYTIMLSFPREK